MSRRIMKRVTCVCILVAIVAMGQVAMAQSTIFNIPSTDTVAKKKVYFEFDYLVQAPKAPGGDRLHLAVPRGVVGLGPNLEAGANVAFVHVGGETNAYFQPNLKWRFVNNESNGVAASVGGILYTPIDDRDGVDTYGLVYANLSKKVKHTYGPRFTVGPYGIAGSNDGFVGPKAGALVGYEQPIHARVSIVADWLSGKNGFGYLTPGISILLPRNGLLNIGYSIGNDSYANDNASRNRLLFFYYGVTF
jgi:hypothetical protein